MLFMTLFFESVCFPTIVALGIRGLGRHYKRGSGLIVAGVSGGAVVPPILGHVADMRNSTGFAMIIPTMVCLASPKPHVSQSTDKITNHIVCLSTVHGRRLDLRRRSQLRPVVPRYRRQGRAE